MALGIASGLDYREFALIVLIILCNGTALASYSSTFSSTLRISNSMTVLCRPWLCNVISVMLGFIWCYDGIWFIVIVLYVYVYRLVLDYLLN